MPPKDPRFNPQSDRCFVCSPSPLPEPFQNDQSDAFVAGMAYALVVLSFCEEGAGICDVHRPMLKMALDEIEGAIDALEEEGAIQDAGSEMFAMNPPEGPSRAN